MLVYRSRDGELIELNAYDNTTSVMMDNSTFVSIIGPSLAAAV